NTWCAAPVRCDRADPVAKPAFSAQHVRYATGAGMLKKVALVVILLAAGVAIAMYMRIRPTGAAPAVAFQPQTDASAEVRITDLERALAAQIDRSRTLEARIVGLEDRLRSGG